MLAITARELRTLFYSPLAWSVLATAQLILGWVFIVRIEEFLALESRLIALDGAPGVTDLVAAPLLETTALVTLLLTPLLGMRMFADEYRTGTIALLLSAPISTTRIVLGKYLALWLTLSFPALLSLVMVLSLAQGTDLDYGKISAGMLGLLLLAAMFGALGLLASSLTDHPAVAAATTYGVLLILWTLQGSASRGEALAWLSPAMHLGEFLGGLVRSADLVYFLVVTLALLLATVRRIEDRRRFG